MAFEAHALLPLPYGQFRDWLVATPVFDERGRVEPDGSLHVTFGVGILRAGPQDDQSALRLECGDAAGLQALRDFIADTAADAGIAPVWQERHRPGKPANLCLARVERVERLSPSFRRLWLHGADLARLLRGGLHFRLLLGPEGADWPSLDASGLTDWPGGQAAWHRPVYTVRSIEGDGAATRVSVDIFLHAGGRVGRWSEGLQPGMEVALLGPSGGDIPGATLDPPPWFGLFGDETALPAIARILAALPPSATGRAAIQVPTAADIQSLPHPPGVALRWLVRETQDPPARTALLDALQAAPLPAANRFVFFAAEAGETSLARRFLDERGLTKQEFWAQTYWQRTGA